MHMIMFIHKQTVYDKFSTSMEDASHYEKESKTV